MKKFLSIGVIVVIGIAGWIGFRFSSQPPEEKIYVAVEGESNITVIDAAIDEEVARIPVGKEPNGVSIWHRTLGGTP